MKLGKVIKEIRLNKMLTQVEAAKKIKMSQTYLSDIERGKAKPTLETIEKIAKGLKIPVEKKDVSPKKKAIFAALKPLIDKLIYEHMIK